MSAESSSAWFGLVVACIDHDQPNSPYIDLVRYPCPDTVDDADIRSHFEGLEIALIDLNGTHVPRLDIHCRTRKTAESISRFLLESSIFSHYLGELQKVSLFLNYRGWATILPDEILSAPTQFTMNDITILLDTAQRAEWLLSKDRWHSWRDRYLQDLLEAAHAASAAPDANSQLAMITPPGADVGGPAQTEENAESRRQVNKDGEAMVMDEPDTAEAG